MRRPEMEKSYTVREQNGGGIISLWHGEFFNLEGLQIAFNEFL